MEFESPDVEKDFPGLYASGSLSKNESDDSDDSHEKHSKKDLLIGKRKDKKDKGYAALEGESSEEEFDVDISPSKTKKTKSFKFPTKKEKKDKIKDPDKDDKRKKELDRDERKKDKEKEDKKKKEEDKKKKEKEEDKKKKDKDDEKKKKDRDEEKKKKDKEGKLKLKLKEKKKKSEDFDLEQPIFGVPLYMAIERNRCHDGINLPAIVRECIDFVEENGLHTEGIYKVSAVKSKLVQLKSSYNRRESINFEEHDPNTVASLLKQFLRDLPEPLLTSELLPQFEESCNPKTTHICESLLSLMNQLPQCNRLLLSWIIMHMFHVIENEKHNKMSLQAVILTLAPVLQISNKVLTCLFHYAEALFGTVVLKKYVPPIKPGSSHLSYELPETPEDIQEEISKQESVLNHLHIELNSGVVSKKMEEELWEVQRIITLLKRKLRMTTRKEPDGKGSLEKICHDSNDLEDPHSEGHQIQDGNSPDTTSNDMRLSNDGEEVEKDNDTARKEVISDDHIDQVRPTQKEANVPDSVNVDSEVQDSNILVIHVGGAAQPNPDSVESNGKTIASKQLVEELIKEMFLEEQLLRQQENLHRKIEAERNKLSDLLVKMGEINPNYSRLVQVTMSSQNLDEESHYPSELVSALEESRKLTKRYREFCHKIQDERQLIYHLNAELQLARLKKSIHESSEASFASG